MVFDKRGRKRNSENANSILNQKITGEISLKITEEGAVAIYGMGRAPVILGKPELVKIIDNADKIQKFLDQNQNKLKLRGRA